MYIVFLIFIISMFIGLIATFFTIKQIDKIEIEILNKEIEMIQENAKKHKKTILSRF